jgi:hypothetical protein
MVFGFLLLAWSVSAQQKPEAFSEARSIPDLIEPKTFEFSLEDHNYRISDFGYGTRSDKNGRRTHSFKLQLERHFRLTRTLYYKSYQGDLLLIGEESNVESGSGFISRLSGTTFKTKWRQTINAFNIGQALLDGSSAYVTGVGFVGKVNLKAGAYIWRHSNLYQRGNGAFTSFELPVVQGNVVIFSESVDYLRKKKAVIRVDRSSGKIIKVGL